MERLWIKSGLITAFLVLVMSQNINAGGGWPLPKGQLYIKVAEWWVVSDQHYTDEGRIDPNITMGVFNTYLYTEYGITDRLTGILYFPFFSRNYSNNIVSGTTGELLVPGEAINGIGDTDLSLKYGLTPGSSPVAIAATLTLGLPLGQTSGGSLGNLQLGDGEFNQILSLDAGTGWQWGNTPFYGNISAGFNNRSNGFSDEIRSTIELGTNLFQNKVWLIGRARIQESLKNGLTAATANATSIFANNSEFVSLEGEVSYQFNDKIGVSVAMAQAIRGEVIFASPSFSIGIFGKF